MLACGCFVLVVCEGQRHSEHTAFYDLYRLEGDLIVERWNTVEAVAPPEEWKHSNGKF